MSSYSPSRELTAIYDLHRNDPESDWAPWVVESSAEDIFWGDKWGVVTADLIDLYDGFLPAYREHDIVERFRARLGMNLYALWKIREDINPKDKRFNILLRLFHVFSTRHYPYGDASQCKDDIAAAAAMVASKLYRDNSLDNAYFYATDFLKDVAVEWVTLVFGGDQEYLEFIEPNYRALVDFGIYLNACDRGYTDGVEEPCTGYEWVPEQANHLYCNWVTHDWKLLSSCVEDFLSLVGGDFPDRALEVLGNEIRSWGSRKRLLRSSSKFFSRFAIYLSWFLVRRLYGVDIPSSKFLLVLSECMADQYLELASRGVDIWEMRLRGRRERYSEEDGVD